MDHTDFISRLKLERHPEGGWYREVYRSEKLIAPGDEFPGGRCYMTSIYFLISADSFSALHRIRSDETWHFYLGDPLEVIEFDDSGNLIKTVIGNNADASWQLQYTVKANRWFGSRILKGGRWALVGCNVAPGFDFRDFELAERNVLCGQFPKHNELINSMTRK